MNFKIYFQNEREVTIQEDEGASYEETVIDDIKLSFDDDLPNVGKGKVFYKIKTDYISDGDTPMWEMVDKLKDCLDRILDQKKIDAQEETFELK